MSSLVTKSTNWHVRPAKTQINLGIRSVWSVSSLCAQCVAKDPSFLHADNENSDRAGRMPRLIWVFAGHTCHLFSFLSFFFFFFFFFFCFVTRRLKWDTTMGYFQRRSRPWVGLCNRRSLNSNLAQNPLTFRIISFDMYCINLRNRHQNLFTLN